MERGELPALARLAAAGGFARVATTHPAQTPVAWSTFATGVNPGGHGIYDFLRRDPATCRPDLGLVRYEQSSAFLPPRAVNLRSGTPVWETLARAGVPAVVLRCPCSYPPDEVKGRLLSGMGVPDVRGGLGTPTFFSPLADVAPGESEIVARLEPDGRGGLRGRLPGPPTGRGGEDAGVDLTVVPDPAGGGATVHSAGQPRALEVPLGGWSGWLEVRFRLGALQSVRGIVRFHLVALEPAVELYASPVNFDPDAPRFPISAPWDYAGELERRIGPYHTAGMAEDHTGIVNGRLDEAAFLAQCDDVMREREAMVAAELDRYDEGLFYALFDTPDRIQHLFWRYFEPDHPAHRGQAPEPAMARVIPEHYARCDRIVGDVLDRVDDSTLVVVLSDHGFAGFRRGVHLNSWLLERGLLALLPGVEPGEGDDLLRGIDWPRTKAYAVGLGALYLNLRGRERDGIVEPADAPELAAAIAAELTGLPDPADGQAAVRGVRRAGEIWTGERLDEAPDLLVLFEDGYRASWATGLGGLGRGTFEDNVRKWSGDHIVDPALVPGALFMSRPFDASAPRLVDLAPTILHALGVPAPAELEGRSLLA
jgi:predicted AlkP superfamily phosphohydrolase/phosphomutase